MRKKETNIREKIIKHALKTVGTPFLYKPSRVLGAMGTKNNQETTWAETLDADNIDPYRPGMDGCYKCPVHCRARNDMTPEGKGGWGAKALDGLRGNASYGKKAAETAHAHEKSYRGINGDGEFDRYDKGDGPEYVTLGFEHGYPVSVNGERLEPAGLVSRLNAIAGAHGVGRADIVEDRLVVAFPRLQGAADSEKQLEVAATPSPFMPNGDGINDEPTLSYKLREVTAARAASPPRGCSARAPCPRPSPRPAWSTRATTARPSSSSRRCL